MGMTKMRTFDLALSTGQHATWTGAANGRDTMTTVELPTETELLATARRIANLPVAEIPAAVAALSIPVTYEVRDILGFHAPASRRPGRPDPPVHRTDVPRCGARVDRGSGRQCE